MNYNDQFVIKKDTLMSCMNRKLSESKVELKKENPLLHFQKNKHNPAAEVNKNIKII